MQEIVRTKEEASELLERSVVTIGNFDGMHIGHQAIFQQACHEANSRDATVVALTFEPHPQAFFRPDDAPARLSPPPYKFELMQEYGAELVVALQFDESISTLEPAEFIEDILVDTLKAEHVVVGQDFRFGKKRAGDTETLREIGADHELTLTVEDFVEFDGETVSSTRIRHAVENGQMEAAEAMLGRAYRLYGEIGHGEKRGRQLGFPTANLEVVDMAIPPAGVYVTTLGRAGEQHWRAITNIGIRPTFDGREMTIETFVLDERVDEQLDLYDEQVELDVYRKVREERRFDSPDKLIARIQRDIEEAEAFFDREEFDGG